MLFTNNSQFTNQQLQVDKSIFSNVWKNIQYIQILKSLLLYFVTLFVVPRQSQNFKRFFSPALLARIPFFSLQVNVVWDTAIKGRLKRYRTVLTLLWTRTLSKPTYQCAHPHTLINCVCLSLACAMLKTLCRACKCAVSSSCYRVELPANNTAVFWEFLRQSFSLHLSFLFFPTLSTSSQVDT